MEHILLAQVESPPDTREHRHKVFIIDHPCCDLLFELGMEHSIFDMDDGVLFNPARWEDGMDISRRLSDTVNRLIASEKSIVFIPYQPDILRAMGELAAEMWSRRGDVWLFFAFFHDDHDTRFMHRLLPEDAAAEEAQELEQELALKAEWILTLGQFLFVKMAEIKVREIITSKTLRDLFTEYAPEH